MRYGELRVWTDVSSGTPLVGAEGEVDLGTVDALRSAASQVVASQPLSVVFDLRKVTFMDSSGLGVLVATRKRLGSRPGAVVVVTSQPAVLQSLAITGLDRIFTVQRDLAPVPSGTVC